MAVELAAAYVSIIPDTSKIAPGVEKALGGVEKTADKSGQSMGSKIGSGLKKTLKVGAVGAGAAAGGLIASSLNKGFKRLDAVDQAQAKFKGLGKSASESAAIMDDVTESVEGTSFLVGDAADAAAMALAAGVEPGDELQGILRTIGDSASFAGKEFGEMSPIFTKALNEGRVTGETLAQLGDNAVPAIQALSDELGVSADEVRKLASAGEISFEDFQKAMDGAIGGQGQKSAETFSGALSNVQAAIGRVGETILSGSFSKGPAVFANLITGIDGFNERVQATMDYLSGAEGARANVFDAFGSPEAANTAIATIDNVKQKWSEFTAGLRGEGDTSTLFGSLGDSFNKIGTAAMRAAPALGQVMASLSQAGMTTILVSLTSVLAALAPTIANILVPAFESLGNWMSDNQSVVNALVMSFAGFKILNSTAGMLATFGTRLVASKGGLVALKAAAMGSVSGFTSFGSSIGKAASATKGFFSSVSASAQLGAMGSKMSEASGFAQKFGVALGKTGSTIKGGFSSALAASKTGLAAFGTGLKTVGTAAKGALTSGLRVAATGVRTLGAAIAANPIGAIIVAITAVVAALTWFFTKTELGKQIWSGFMDVLKGVWEWVSTVFAAGWNWLADTISGAWQRVLGATQAVWGAISGWLSSAWNGIKNIASAIWGGITAYFSMWWNNLKLLFTGQWGQLASNLTGQMRGLLNWIRPVWDGIVGFFSGVWARIKGVFTASWNAISGWIRGAWAGFAGVVSSVWNGIKNTIVGVWQSIKSSISGIWQGIHSSLSGGFDRVVGVVAGVKDKILGAVSGAGRWLVDTGTHIVNGLKEGLEDKIKTIGEWFLNKLPSFIRKPFEKALNINSPSRVFADYGHYIGDGLINGLDDKAGAVKAASQQMANQAADVNLPTVSPQVNTSPAPAAAPTAPATGGDDLAAMGTGFTAMGQQVTDTATTLLDPALIGVGDQVMSMGQSFTDTATGVVTPAFAQMGAGLNTVKTSVIDPAFAGVRNGLVATGNTFAAQTGLSGNVWQNMGNRVMSIKTTLVDPAFAGVRGGLAATGNAFIAGTATARNVWSQMGSAVMAVKTGTIDPAFAGIQGGLRNVVSAFSTGASGIANQWNRVREATAAPVRFAIQSVFNQGIVGMWNSATELLGTKKMDPYPVKFKAGGPVRGPGSGTSDSIPAMISNGEYVVKKKAVDQIGVRNLDAMNSGRMKFAANAFNDKTFKNVAVHRAGGGLVEGSKGWKQLKRGYDWARSRNGRPYVWGGSANGGGGADCSGFMSGIADVILGGSGARQWATGNFPGTQQGAWKSGLASGFSVGISGEHTAGTIGGVPGLPAVNVESGGANSRMKFATSDAAGANDGQFPRKFHMIVTDGGGFKPGIGGSSGGFDPAALIDAETAPYKKKIKDALKKYEGKPGLVNRWPAAIAGKMQGAAEKKMLKAAEDMGGGPMPGGGGAERWRPMSKRAMTRTGFNAGDKRQVDAMIKQINTESSGNPRAVQGIKDVNSGGNEAQGLLQVIPPTFAANRDPALPNNPFDAFANMNAALRYYKGKYGMDLTTMWGHGHGYDNGGYLPAAGTQVVHNDSGKPEPVFTHQQWKILRKAVTNAVNVDWNDLKGSADDIAVAGALIADAAEKFSNGAWDKAGQKVIDGQMSDALGVFGFSSPESWPLAKAAEQLNEATKDFDKKKAKEYSEARGVSTSDESLARGQALTKNLASAGAQVAAFAANPTPAGIAKSAGGQTVNIAVDNPSRAFSEYRRMQAKASRATAGV